MASVRDIPLVDIEIFLVANSKTLPNNENAAYNLAFSLFKNKNSVGYTPNIITWIIAHNLIKNKVEVPDYTAVQIDNMSQIEIDKLSKLLTMKKNDIVNVKKILNYMNKLDEEVDIRSNRELTAAGKEIYDVILSNLISKDLGRMEINKYSKFVLEDQKYWKNRLLEKLGLTTNDPDFDYKFAVKFLENGKSLEDNYHEAMEKGLKPVIKLLLDNEVVKPVKPFKLLDNLSTNLPELAEFKNLPYDDFLNKIIDINNEIFKDDPELQISRKDMNKIEFTGGKFIYELDNVNLIIEIDSGNKGITNGEILYDIAKQLKNDNEIRDFFIKYVEENSKEILKEIEDGRSQLNKAKIADPRNRFSPNKELILKKIYEQPTKSFLSNLIKNPEAFIDYCNKNGDEFRFLPIYDYYYGSHIYFEGLTYSSHGQRYYVDLGS